jgi:ubiquinone/menaquinone biosynthesis C-methylase UbiE
MPDPNSPSLWDGIAASYDGMRPDQGLTDPTARAAWLALIGSLLPRGRNHVLDVGCGTGSLSLLLASEGHEVTGLDFAPAMIAVARTKAAATGADVRFVVADATAPDFPPTSFDAILCRQTLWALPDRALALQNWATLLRPGGRLILVEGLFASGRGMSEAEILAALPDAFAPAEVSDLGLNHALWGGPIPDQRLLVTTTRL